MKIAVLILIACGMTCAGCARSVVELYRGTLPRGEIYALVHKASHVPFSDGGALYLIVNPGKKEEAEVRLSSGYDIYTDLQLRVAMSDDVLFVREERYKQTWAINFLRNSIIDREPNGLEFVDVGESFRR
jgi:hypothetical protein